MDADIQPKPKRKVTFEVSEEEARQIAGYIRDAFNAHINTPFSSAPLRTVRDAFGQIADGH